WCWGNAAQAYFGAPVSTPTLVPSFASGVRSIQGGDAHLCALMDDGTINCVGGNNGYQLGDGSKMPSRRKAASVVASDGGVHQLDTDGSASGAFTVVASGTGVNVNANVRFKSQDVGRVASTYVFALVPRAILGSA